MPNVYLLFKPLTCGCALIFFSGATTSSARVMSGGGKESEGEVDRQKDAEGGNVYSRTSQSHSVGVTNQNGGSIDLDQVSLVCILIKETLLILAFFLL